MNPTILSFKVTGAMGIKSFQKIMPSDAIELGPCTYLLQLSDNMDQILEQASHYPELRDCAYTAISLKTKTLRQSGHDKALQILQSIDYELV
jgi:hypothetical protein